MATTATGKRTTLADLMAAAKIGAIDPSTEVLTSADVAKIVRKAEAEAASSAPGRTSADMPDDAPIGTEHDCAIPGCRHGDAHTGTHQPDRQLKLECPKCGAVARMTARAIGRCGGNAPICGGDGATFAVAARRTYIRKAA